jgi:CTP synthase
MSPFEHGEVFVTDDGAETDLDLGHYERFTGVSARMTDSISSGRIYSNVLEKERRGDYLGKTIQVIPHVTNEIKDFLSIGDDEVDFMLCEIGGTVGDIEGLPFFEAIRQFIHERPRGQSILMHLTLLPYLAASRRAEDQAHPAQRQGTAIHRPCPRRAGLPVSEHPIPDRERKRSPSSAMSARRHVIPAYDLKTIYEAPLAYHRAGLDQAVLDAFGITPAPKPNLARWEDVMDRITHPEGEVRVAIVGKYTQLEDAYKSIAEALTHGGMANRTKVRAEWIDAEIFEREDPAPYLENFHAILVPGGFGERGTEGKIKAAHFAREKQDPLSGHLPGHADGGDRGRPQPGRRAERRVRGIRPRKAGAKRFTPVVYHLKEWVQGNHTVRRKADDAKGGTMRLGAYTANLKAGSPSPASTAAP